MYYLIIIAFISPLMVLFLAPLTFVKRPGHTDAIVASLAIGLSFALVCHGITYSDPEVDALRIMRECAATRGLPIYDVLASPPSESTSLFLLNLWEWIVGQIGDLRLFQAIAAFLGYSMLAWLMFDCMASGRCTKSEFATILIFVLIAVPMQTVVGNVRSTLVCIMAATAFYIQSKREAPSIPALCILILSCGIHVIGYVGLLLWSFRKPAIVHPWKVSAAFIGGIALVSIFAFVLSSFFGSLGFINDFLQKLLLYKEGTDYDQVNAGKITTQLTHAMELLLLCLMVLRLKVAGRKSQLVSLSIVSIACTFAMELLLVNVGTRLMYLPLLMSACAFLCGEKSPSTRRQVHILILLDLSICIIAFVLSGYSWIYFLRTFNWEDVLLGAVFLPASLFV